MGFNAYYNTWGQDQLSLPFIGKEAFHAHREGRGGWHQTVLTSKQVLYLVPCYFPGKYRTYVNQMGEKVIKKSVLAVHCRGT